MNKLLGGEGLGIPGLEKLDAGPDRLDPEKPTRGAGRAGAWVAGLDGGGLGVGDQGEGLGEGFVPGAPQGIGGVFLGRTPAAWKVVDGA